MSARRLGSVVLAIALLVGSAAPRRAAAFTLLEDPFEGDELTLGASIKSFFFGLHGDTLELGGLYDFNPAAMGLLVLRPKLEAQVGDIWRVAVHYEMAATASTTGASLDSALATGRTSLPPPRFLPLHWTPADHEGFLWRHTVDWVWFRTRLGPVDVTVGRQPITLGRATLWRPYDLLSTFAPTEIDTEFKPGVDALRFDFSLTDTYTLAVIAVAGERAEDHDAEVTLEGSSFAARLKLGFPTWEIGFFSGYVREDVVFGVDAFVDLQKVSLHAEATVTWVPDERRADLDGEVFARATAGVIWTIPRFQLIAELHYNGVGGADPEDYFQKAISPRSGIGELFTLGRYYAGLVVRWEAHPLLSLSLVTMANLRDPSVLFTPGLVYNIGENMDLVLGAILPVGRSPELSLTTQKARSEYGIYPFFYYLELKVAM